MIDEAALFAVKLALWLLGVVAPFYLAYRWLRSRRPSTAARPMTSDGAGGKVVPLVAAFTGVRVVPWWALAQNNANPRLVIGPTSIAYRVLRSCVRPDDEIKQLDLRTFGATVILSFTFRNWPLTFDANVGSIALATKVLDLLADRVTLSARARAQRDAPRSNS